VPIIVADRSISHLVIERVRVLEALAESEKTAPLFLGHEAARNRNDNLSSFPDLANEHHAWHLIAKEAIERRRIPLLRPMIGGAL